MMDTNVCVCARACMCVRACMRACACVCVVMMMMMRYRTSPFPALHVFARGNFRVRPVCMCVRVCGWACFCCVCVTHCSELACSSLVRLPTLRLLVFMCGCRCVCRGGRVSRWRMLMIPVRHHWCHDKLLTNGQGWPVAASPGHHVSVLVLWFSTCVCVCWCDMPTASSLTTR